MDHYRTVQQYQPTLRQLRYDRTRASNLVKATIKDNLTKEDKPEWRTPDGLPSWWAYWNDDVLYRLVREAVRAARKLELVEGSTK